MRSRLKLRYQIPEGFEFRIARTVDEFESAYRILHDNYVDEGFMNPDPSGMRITKYFAMPSTTTLIAVYKGDVVGTISIVRRSNLGLPIEEAFDISALEASGKIVAEVSALAIDKNFREKRGALFLPLIKYFYEFATTYMRIDRIVIATVPEWADFYEGILRFKHFEKKSVDQYEFANNVRAIGMWLDLEQAREDYRWTYDHKPLSQNLYHYFTQTKMSAFQFPDRKYVKVADPVMTPEMLSYFFFDRANIFPSLRRQDQLTVASAYSGMEYRLIWPKYLTTNDRDSRFAASLEGGTEAGVHNLRVLEVSRTGLRIYGVPPSESAIQLNIKISESDHAQLTGEIVWRDEKSGICGIRIQGSDNAWENYINYLASDYEDLVKRTA